MDNGTILGAIAFLIVAFWAVKLKLERKDHVLEIRKLREIKNADLFLMNKQLQTALKKIEDIKVAQRLHRDQLIAHEKSIRGIRDHLLDQENCKVALAKAEDDLRLAKASLTAHQNWDQLTDSEDTSTSIALMGSV